jgi:hypothetical protein
MLAGDGASYRAALLDMSFHAPTEYLQRWRATDNGQEAQAAQHSDGLLVLDELGQVDPKVAGESAYMLANGQGKARAGAPELALVVAVSRRDPAGRPHGRGRQAHARRARAAHGGHAG